MQTTNPVRISTVEYWKPTRWKRTNSTPPWVRRDRCIHTRMVTADNLGLIDDKLNALKKKSE